MVCPWLGGKFVVSVVWTQFFSDNYVMQLTYAKLLNLLVVWFSS